MQQQIKVSLTKQRLTELVESLPGRDVEPHWTFLFRPTVQRIWNCPKSPFIFHTYEQYWYALVRFKTVAYCSKVVSVKDQPLYDALTLIKDITFLCLV